MNELNTVQRWIRRLAVLALILVSIVVMLGAWTRLKDSGLGCPDWPGCYGHINVFKAIEHVDGINQQSPGALRESHKTIPEMVHRYFASTLGLVIMIICALSLWQRKQPEQPVGLPLSLLALVIFQGMLGMWTVTEGLQPTVVMLHLLGGFTTFTLLAWLTARLYRWPEFLNDFEVRMLRPWAISAVVVLALQIALGGWTAANYAAVVCTELPVCEEGWQDHLDFEEALTFWGHEITQEDYEFGVLENDARTTIHVMHRFGAVLATLVIGLLALCILKRARSGFYRTFGSLILVLLTTQVGLGISNILFQVPLNIAVAHNFVAVLLLATLVLFLRAITIDPCKRQPRHD